jgi:hypothetical protein
LQTAKASGEKFMSGRVKPKMAREHPGASENPPAKTATDFSDDIPF